LCFFGPTLRPDPIRASFPILVDGAKVPKADRLPKDLEELEQRNGREIRHASFHSDVDKLIRGLKGLSDRADDTGSLASRSRLM
jgi:hypothetical protein